MQRPRQQQLARLQRFCIFWGVWQPGGQRRGFLAAVRKRNKVGDIRRMDGSKVRDHTPNSFLHSDIHGLWQGKPVRSTITMRRLREGSVCRRRWHPRLTRPELDRPAYRSAGVHPLCAVPCIPYPVGSRFDQPLTSRLRQRSEEMHWRSRVNRVSGGVLGDLSVWR